MHYSTKAMVVNNKRSNAGYNECKCVGANALKHILRYPFTDGYGRHTILILTG